jgi:hypothetical protein
MNNLKKDEYIKCLNHMSIFMDIQHFDADELRELHIAAMRFVINCKYELDKLKERRK